MSTLSRLSAAVVVAILTAVAMAGCTATAPEPRLDAECAEQLADDAAAALGRSRDLIRAGVEVSAEDVQHLREVFAQAQQPETLCGGA